MVTMNIEITGITIVLDDGADRVSLDTTLVNPIYPFDGLLSIDFKVAKDKAIGYCERNFPDLKAKVKNLRNKPEKEVR